MDEIDDEHKVLRDGERVRVPLVMMDGRTVAVDCGPGGPHRPGFRYNREAQAVRDESYDAMVQQAANAWKSDTRRIADTERAAKPPLCEDAREDAYRRYIARTEAAWRRP
jgi:hypothetical protein